MFLLGSEWPGHAVRRWILSKPLEMAAKSLMNYSTAPEIDPNEVVDQILADYFTRSENGEAIDRNELLCAQPPEIASLLLRFFTIHDALAEQTEGRQPGETERQFLDATRASGVHESPRDVPSPADEDPEQLPEEELFATLPARLGRFHVLQKLGRGGMGTVYLAEDPAGGHARIALKIPNSGRHCPRDLVERLFREARLLQKLQHPHICQVYDAGTADGLPYIAMQFIPGESLDLVLARSARPWPPDKIARLMLTAAQALQAAHDQGIIHRDLKPSNFMLDQRGEPVLTDFGLALQYDNAAVSRLTRSSVMVGTLVYISPELARYGRPAVVPASDVYSLGVMFFEMLAGERPFADEEGGWFPPQLIWDRPKRHPSEIAKEVDPDLAAICLWMLEKKLSRRPASIAIVADQLTRWLAGERGFMSLPWPADDAAETVEFTPASESDQKQARRQSRIRFGIWTSMVLVLVCLSLMVIQVQTDRGELVITSSVPEVQLVVKRNGTAVRDLTVTTGVETVSVYSGQVEVEIRGANADQYQVRNGKVVLSRGKREVVQIERKPETTAKVAVAATESPAQPMTVPAAVPVKPAVPAKPRIGEFVPLFNGKDVQDWVLDGSKVTTLIAKDGELTADNWGPKDYWDHLYTKRTDYENFELRLEFRTDAGGYGVPEVMVRVDPSPIVFGGMRGYLVRLDRQVGSQEAERVTPVALRLSSRVRGDLDLVSASEPPLANSSWQQLTIQADGSHLNVVLNGKLVLSYIDQGETFRQGAIALRFKDQTRTVFRNIEIKELPPLAKIDDGGDRRRRWMHQSLSGNQWNETWGIYQHVAGDTWIESVVSHPSFRRYEFVEVQRTEDFIELERDNQGQKVIVRLYADHAQIGPAGSQLRKAYHGVWQRSP